MTTLNAATLIGWVRVELGAEVYPEPAKTQPPGWYHIRLRAPNLKRLRPTPPLPA